VPSVLIAGTSHLAFRLGKKLRAKGVACTHIPSNAFDELTLEKSDLEHAKEVFGRHGIADAHAVFLVDDSDARNINLLLAALGTRATGNHKANGILRGVHPVGMQGIPFGAQDDTENEGVRQHSQRIYVAITNENLASHIAASHAAVHVFNPNAISATTFVNAVRDHACARPDDHIASVRAPTFAHFRADRIIQKLLILYGAVVIGGTLFFRWSEDATWSDGLYLIATVVSGLNFEDSIVHNYTLGVKIARTALILGVQVFTLIAFSFIVDRLIKRRTEIVELGRKRYTLKDHVIVCGLGRTGFHITMELLHRREKVVVIESNTDNRFLNIVRAAGAKVLIGDASLAKNLMDADVKHAAGLISAIGNDLRNLEIGLNARSLRKDIRLILRIFEREIADEMKTRFNIHFAYSTSTLAAQHLVGLLMEPEENGETLNPKS
jgi:voltage-gated potassium channel Kch